jgi:hypothetical protein
VEVLFASVRSPGHLDPCHGVTCPAHALQNPLQARDTAQGALFPGDPTEAERQPTCYARPIRHSRRLRGVELTAPRERSVRDQR